MRFYSTVEVVRSTDATYRQVDYWLRIGMIRTVDGRDFPGSGASRYFDEREVRVVQVCATLMDLGCKSTTCAIAAAHLRELTDWNGLLFVRSDGSLARAPDGSGWIVNLTEFEFEGAVA